MKISLKKYADVLIGDVMSVLVNGSATKYRVIKKCHEENLYKSGTNEGCFKQNRKYMCLTPQSDYNFLLGTDKQYKVSGPLTKQNFKNVIINVEGTITFGKQYLKWIHDDVYEHTLSIKTGDVIWNTYDAEHYYIDSFNNVQSMDYGGQTYDASYYTMYAVDKGGSETDKHIRNASWGHAVGDWLKTSHKTYTLNVGDFTMNSEIYYPIVKKD